MARPVFVIMGARVREDGAPSDALLRRTRAALTLGRQSPSALYLATGGRHGGAPPEGQVIASVLLEAGIEPSQILIEQESSDTFESVRACARLLSKVPDVEQVVVCSDRFHLPRCRLLFALFGVPTHRLAMPATMGNPPGWKAAYFPLRELAALPWDAALALGARITSRGAGGPLV
jgi:uncharacterized SAM-binding protein YcdF (DUF218 family)